MKKKSNGLSFFSSLVAKPLGLILGTALFFYGCQSSEKKETGEPQKQTQQKTGQTASQPAQPPRPALKRVSDRPGNTKGEIFIAEYHRILPEEGPYARSVENFSSDLQKLYDLGFRPVTVSEFIENKMILPPGASPVALTFDDSSLSQFKMLPDGTIDPNCAIGILKKFSEEHPDFPVKATFYILPKIPFGQPGFVQQKLALLKQWGCEIGCHTLTHRSLRRMSPDKIKEELGGAIEWIRSLGFEPKTMAVPYGDMPKDASILKSFTWKGKQYGFLANVRSMGRPARSQQAEKPEDPLRVPRLIGSDEPLCLTDWLDKVKKGEVGLYVQP